MDIKFKDLKPMTESPKEDGWYFVIRLEKYDDLFDISKSHFLVGHGWNTWRDYYGKVHEEMRNWDIEEDEDAYWTKNIEINGVRSDDI